MAEQQHQRRTRAIVGKDAKPKMPPHIKLRHEAGRGRWIVLAPERVFEPDEPAVEVLKRCDGERTVSAIAAELAREYNAPEDQILADVVDMLQELADKGVITI